MHVSGVLPGALGSYWEGLSCPASRSTSTMSRTRIAGAGHQGAVRRPHVADDPHLSHVEFRIAAR